MYPIHIHIYYTVYVCICILLFCYAFYLDKIYVANRPARPYAVIGAIQSTYITHISDLAIHSIDICLLRRLRARQPMGMTNLWILWFPIPIRQNVPRAYWVYLVLRHLKLTWMVTDSGQCLFLSISYLFKKHCSNC